MRYEDELETAIKYALQHFDEASRLVDDADHRRRAMAPPSEDTEIQYRKECRMTKNALISAKFIAETAKENMTYTQGELIRFTVNNLGCFDTPEGGTRFNEHLVFAEDLGTYYGLHPAAGEADMPEWHIIEVKTLTDTKLYCPAHSTQFEQVDK